MSDVPPPIERTIENPLLEEDREQLEAAMELRDRVQPLITKAKAAGIDLGDLENQINVEAERAKRIRDSFFPGY